MSGCLGAIAIPATSFLFLLRLWTLSPRYNLVMVFLIALWLGLLGSSWIIPSTIEMAHIGPTHFCITTTIHIATVSIMPVLNTAFVTFAFLAVSWNLFQASYVPASWTTRINGVPGKLKVSYIMLTGGQPYYL